MAKSNNEQRNIALNFITNANETRNQINQLMETIDDTSQEYQDLAQSSRQLEQATESLTNALNNGAGSVSNVQDSIQRLQAQQATAIRTINNTRTAINNQTVSMRSLTSEVTSNGGAMAILDTVTGGWATTAKDSIEALTLFTKGTNLSTVAQRAYTFVVGTSTGALKAFRIALAATGIGAAVVLVGLLVEAWMNLTKATDEATEAQKRFDAQAKISKQIADERISDLEFEAEMLRELARERGASIQEIRQLETEAYNKRLDELKRQMNDESLTIEARREAAKKWSQEYNQNLLREQRWRADDAEKARNTAKETADARVKIAKDSSAELRRIEQERFEFDKKLQELRDELFIGSAVNPTDEIIKKNEVQIRKENEAREKELKNLKRIHKETSETYQDAARVINETYDARIKKLEDSTGEVTKYYKEYEVLFNELSGIIDTGISSEGLLNYYENIINFIDSIKSSDIKSYYEEIFNPDILKENINYIKELQKTFEDFNEELINNPDGEINSWLKFEDFDAVEGQLRRNLDNQIETLEKQKEINIAKLQELGIYEDNKLELEKYYANKKIELEEQTANKISELEQKKRDAKIMTLDVTSNAVNSEMQLTDALLAFASEADQERIKASGAYKTRMIALTTIDMLSGAVAAYTSAIGATGNPITDQILGISSAASVVATGLSNIKKIESVKLKGATDGGGAPSAAAAASATPNVQFVSSSENQIANSVAGAMSNSNQEPIKAYVVTSEVESGLALERNAINNNSL